MEIAILRHGKPKQQNNTAISAKDFVKWVDGYNQSGLAENSLPSSEALAYSQDCSVIVCSTLARSLESANALGKDKIVLSDALFIEAGLPIAHYPLLKLSPKLWAIIFRILWLFGFSRNSEAFKEATQRASQAADQLIQLTTKHDKILFVGHGIFNRLLAKELRRRGWLGPKNPGSNHWSMSVYSNLTKYPEETMD